MRNTGEQIPGVKKRQTDIFVSKSQSNFGITQILQLRNKHAFT